MKSSAKWKTIEHFCLILRISKFKKHYERWQWFWDSRVDINGTEVQYRQIVLNHATQSAANTSQATNWTSLGPISKDFVNNVNHVGQVTSIWVTTPPQTHLTKLLTHNLMKAGNGLIQLILMSICQVSQGC